MDDDLLRKLLDEGVPRREIAARLGVSASTVTRHAGRLGFAIARRRPTRFDWPAIQTYHDAGHSLRECRLRFGFSAGAWGSAISRGDIVPRPVRRQPPRGETRTAVAELLGAGLSQAAIARILGVSPPTVSYHARRLGAGAPDGLRRIDWEAVQRSYDSGLSMRECARLHGFSTAAWSHAVRRGVVRSRPRAMPIDVLLSAPRNRNHVKQRLFDLGLKERRCERCGTADWRGTPIALELHHVNGEPHDNRIENLEILCPNCHSQTDTFAGRNRRSARAP